MIILIFLLLLPLPVHGVPKDGTEVKLPGTLNQVTHYAKFESPSPEEDFIFYLNENLLFYSIPKLSEVNPWVWIGFKTRKRFQQLIRVLLESDSISIALDKLKKRHSQIPCHFIVLLITRIQ